MLGISWTKHTIAEKLSMTLGSGIGGDFLFLEAFVIGFDSWQSLQVDLLRVNFIQEIEGVLNYITVTTKRPSSRP